MKVFEIMYNPYTSNIHFRDRIIIDGSTEPEWREMDDDSCFLRFQGRRCIFENCVEEILDLINKYINVSNELTIQFIGTNEDYVVLCDAIAKDQNPKSKGIICEKKEIYPSPSDTLKKIKSAYKKIANEFDDYIAADVAMDMDDDRREIGDSITRFQETVKPEIPVCVIGNYSVGKSALVNALIGMEILPSHANSTTAKNVYIENGSSYHFIFRYLKVNYDIIIQGETVKIQCDGKQDNELISELFQGIDELKTEERIIHQILESLNQETSTDSKIAKIDSSVRIVLPFKKSELDLKKVFFCLY